MATVRKLIVEVIEARNLLPIDGQGTCSPYVVIDYYGQRKKTQTVERDLNPWWNAALKFDAEATSDVFGDTLEVVVYHDKTVGPTRRNNILGLLKLDSTQFVKKGEEALIHYPLGKKNLFHWVRGDIGLKIYFVDEVVPPPAPAPAPPPAEEAKAAEPAESAAAEEKPKDEGTESAAGSPEEVQDPPEENENPQSGDQISEPPISKPDDDGPVQARASIATVSEPEVKVSNFAEPKPLSRTPSVSNFAGPPPLSRTPSVSSFVSDASDRSTMERSSFDLVEKMHYIFIRVVKARSLATSGLPVVKIAVSGNHIVSRPARKTAQFEWDQTFAFCKDAQDTSSMLEVSVWDPADATSSNPASDVAGHNFLGGICFDVSEILLRDPPDSPLAPQWYRLEGGGAHGGDLMLATWVGTQADESFPDAWKTDTAGNPTSRSKVYQSPKLWYLRSTVIEAQDVFPLITPSKQSSSVQIKAQLGFQVQKTKPAVSSTGSPSWNEDLVFVAAEPFTENFLQFVLLQHQPPKDQAVLGVASIPLSSIERRVDDRQVVSRWFTLEVEKGEKRTYGGRIHLKLCFDGGYHVVEEPAHVCSDYRPTARQLWKPPVGTVELGIIGCKNLLPMKTMGGKGSTDAYAVAKYGNKWVRTRTVSDNLSPRWNEQYTWRVYDPSTVLTIGVFDSWEVFDPSDGSVRDFKRTDARMGKVRVRISTLATGKVYKNTFPLLLLSPAGLRKMGEIELAVRFIRSAQTLELLHVYAQPMLPLMHHLKPLGVAQQEVLRTAAVRLVTAHLSRSEPPLRREVVSHMLDADSNVFSMRKVRANWLRIINVVSSVIDAVRWLEDTRAWRNPTATVLVHALLVLLVWFPDLIIPTSAFYVFTIGAWNYRFRPGRDHLNHFETKLSLAESIDRDELDEEFDGVPCSRPNELVRARYDKMRVLGARVQALLGDVATQGERVQALVAWRDPRATGIFIGLCLVVALVLYVVPSKMIALAFGFYYLRHPLFRDRTPSPALNFFRRLPSLADRML
ncbi:unnamed protein product [Cuscuta campestris]|uniref:C2 domain-containing protein n=1 Tax=Cuscuta campestris TaxID=132261 RepID=A0A484MJV5_9ASTE|nr:unnamed protein product [Cuscuta campestris]